jgi:hypothetical protein
LSTDKCWVCRCSMPHSPEDMVNHHLVLVNSYKSAAIQARGERAKWKAEHSFQASQDRDYSKGKASLETMRCKGAVDALTAFAVAMDQKADEALERAKLPALTAASETGDGK